MPFRHTISFFILLVPCLAHAQQADITGLWKGSLYNDTTQKYYRYEVGISKEKGNRYSGFSHTWFLVGDTQYFGVKKVTVKLAPDGKILIEDDGLIANNYPVPPNKGVRQLNVLTLDASSSVMKLTGPFSTNRTKEYHSLTGSIDLERKNDFWQSSLIPHLEELGKADELSFVKEERQATMAATRQQQEKLLKDQQEERSMAIANTKQEQLKAQQSLELTKEEAKRSTELERAEKVRQEDARRELAKQEKSKMQQVKAQEAEAIRVRQENDKIVAAQKKTLEKEIARQNETAQKQARASAATTASVQAKTNTAAPGEISRSMAVLPSNTAAAAEVGSRKTVVQQTVNFSSDSLQLSLYDNGEIDGDTVSVLMNGQLILAKQGLGTRAIKHMLYIPKDTQQIEIVMYAESLGAIPPNTGLLVIRDGKDLYEIRFSGDLQKNASIILNRKKE